MRMLILFTVLATLLATLLPAGSVSADSTFNLQSTSKPTFPGFCKRLNKHVKQCLRGRRIRNEAALACDRVEEAQRLLCGTREVILAPRSADSSVIDLLRRDYKIVPLEDAVFPYNHIVIEALDLQDPDIIDLLRKAHRAGKTVAIATATEEQVRRFHGLVRTGEDSDCNDPGNPDGLIQLYGLQQSINPSMVGSYCMRNVNHRDPASDRRWLRDRFGAQVPVNLTPVPIFSASEQLASLTVQPQLNDTTAPPQLTNIATGKICSYVNNPDPNVGRAQWDVQVWGMRNFISTTDYYLVNFNPTLTPTVANIKSYRVNSLTLSEIDGSSEKNIDTGKGLIIDTDPQSDTAFVISWTNSKSTTVGGTVGVGASGMGPSVSGSASASVTISNATTTSIPAVTILNFSDTMTLEPSWEFEPQSTALSTIYVPMTTWVWQLPMDAYPLGGTGSNQISFTPGANIFTSTNNSTFIATCKVTVPFPTWTIEPPILTSLTPTSASGGDTVVITGANLYKDIISSVFIGGTPIPSSNLNVVDSTEIKIILPSSSSGLPTGSQKVQVTTNGTMELTSNTLTLDVTRSR